MQGKNERDARAPRRCAAPTAGAPEGHQAGTARGRDPRPTGRAGDWPRRALCGDNLHRFLALGAATVGPDEIAIDSALLLLEDVELAFYRKRGSTLRSLRGRPVAGGGPLRDLVLGEDWTIDQLVVDGEDGATTVPFDPALALVPAA
ncbi:MAG: hypothetical protein ACR2MU_06180 [Gaiellaceae bacterium]